MKHEMKIENGVVSGKYTADDGNEITYSVTTNVVEDTKKRGIDILKEIQTATLMQFNFGKTLV